MAMHATRIGINLPTNSPPSPLSTDLTDDGLLLENDFNIVPDPEVVP